jgi:tetratricopeptide (TPR) repeat protein
MNDGGLSDESQIQAMKLQIEELPKPIKGQKKSARIHNEQGLSYFNDGELEKAVKLFKEASQLDKSDPEILNNLGYALLKQGNVESAEDAILETLAIAPGRATAWQNLGDILAIKNDMPKAIAVYENVYRFSKNRVKTHQFMQKLNVNEDVSSLKQARQMAMNWAKKTYPEINE